jgi:two-component system CheB/CheR fusion protein
MGGSITVSSAPGVGSTFSVSIPFARESEAGPFPDRPSWIPGAASIRVLVVDDDATARRLLASTVAGLGAQVEQAGSGAEALSRVATSSPDLVLLDLHMPDLDGFATTRLLRARAGKALRIFAVTAAAADVDRARSHAAGTDGHFAKPVDVGRLAALLSDLVLERLSAAGPGSGAP